MGQIFYACVYDTKIKTCYVNGADKFHANCYSHSGTVFATHYLLRQKAYRVMWGGEHVITYDALSYSNPSKEDLLGFSTYISYEDFVEMVENDDEVLSEKPWYKKALFIGEQHKLWKRMSVVDVLNDAKRFFDYPESPTVKYSGFLINRTQKLAVDLADYFSRSIGTFNGGVNSAIDLIPVLTETGGGTAMALFDGLSSDSTEKYAGSWCGDLLQIVDTLPPKYELMPCCFACFLPRAYYLYKKFGVDKEYFILCDKNGTRYKYAVLDIIGEHRKSQLYYVMLKVTKKKIDTKCVPVE
ncbi:MAG: hypothetical protein LBU65_01495 [Planctomycetaceae bacterium]|jgi:hypothetical protein|nr:hypothetical protein [Planctomycetaceae bacterium]